MKPPPLKNDCFALPRGVNWVPVDTALDHLRRNLTGVKGQEVVKIHDAEARFLASDVTAVTANPPTANSAVDGYGFAGGASAGEHSLPLHKGRAAAGAAFHGTVPVGAALRILTGAVLPEGVETVVLEEDVNASSAQIAFNGPLKRGANTRDAGEDAKAGDVIAHCGQRIRSQEIAIFAACGIGEVQVYKPLRIGVLSTGDEIAEAGTPPVQGRIYDANRPMLLSLVRRWGFQPVDLGHVGDDRDALRHSLDKAATQADVILTSGGASAGDEDHVSALLAEAGAIDHWRIALKPGRPLALGIWGDIPVFGLPGNPVAAFVCTLIFAAPAFRVLAGGNWRSPSGFTVPAAFSKNKKPGRREYLRARLNADGAVEVFGSEGSGRISGLSWADGLVELPDGAMDIGPGDKVHYIPFACFGE